MRIRRTLTAAAIATLTVAGAGGTAGTAAAAPAASPLATYIVTLDRGSTPSDVAARAASMLGGRTGHVYNAALKGFSIELPTAAAGRLRDLPGVVAVEADQQVQASATTQSGATWGLDRIDDAEGLDGSYTYTNTGSGVTAYVIDTGITLGHKEFTGRVVSGVDKVDGGKADDCNGHGTHVAGTIGGTTYGVAKKVKLVAVRVLNCQGSGTMSGVIAGVDWVTSNHAAGQPAVANMSLGGGASTALDQAVEGSIADGVTYAVAAGNDTQDACNYSPAKVPTALTVGATNRTDAAASFSNYGPCVDLFAPGVDITSAWYARRSTTATNTISGTSMAAPHVAGVAALHLQDAPGATPADVALAIAQLTTKDAVPTTETANNDLLFTNY